MASEWTIFFLILLLVVIVAAFVFAAVSFVTWKVLAALWEWVTK